MLSDYEGEIRDLEVQESIVSVEIVCGDSLPVKGLTNILVSAWLNRVPYHTYFVIPCE